MSDNHTVDKWDKRYLQVAKLVATWSKDPSTQVGAVSVGPDGQILSQGYNGFPRGVHDYDWRLAEREIKLKYTVHAEMNCIYNASLIGATLKNSKMYVYGLPTCSECSKGIVQAGIKDVVLCFHHPVTSKLQESYNLTKQIFSEAGVLIKEFTSYELDA